MRALDDSDPRLIGRFAVLGLLGAGGMGRVYLARPVHGPDHPDALVAVKVIRPELADDGPFRERFRREVGAAARVNALFTAEVVDADPDAPALPRPSSLRPRDSPRIPNHPRRRGVVAAARSWRSHWSPRYWPRARSPGRASRARPPPRPHRRRSPRPRRPAES